MGVKMDENTIKYKIIARFEVDGVVERPDIIGAIFGQTDGLLPPDLNLRDLQKNGQLGRIEVKPKSEGGKTTGVIELPTNLDKVRTAIIAATVETVDRVGPCHAKVTLEKIEDVREAKRLEIIERAAEIVKGWEEEETEFPEVTSLIEEKTKKTKKAPSSQKKKQKKVEGLIKYGPENLAAGEDLPTSKEIIIVEGRADVINLLRAGIKNAIEVGGTSIPDTVKELTKKRTTTAFLDGDRGGEFILKELLQVARPDFVARAPKGKEVEDLTPKEIHEALANKTPLEQTKYLTGHRSGEYVTKAKTLEKPRREKPSERMAKTETRRTKSKSSTRRPERKHRRTERTGRRHDSHRASTSSRFPPLDPPLKAAIQAYAPKLKGSFQSYLLDKDYVVIEQVPTAKLYDKIKQLDNGIHAIVYDGVLTRRIAEAAAEKNIDVVAATVKGEIRGSPERVRLLTLDQA